MRLPFAVLAILAVLVLAAPARAAEGPTVRFDTSLGAIDVRLLPDDAPNTVATFLRYVNARTYDSSYFHRSVRDYILQGGGYTQVAGTSTPINELLADVDPPVRSNTRGTLAVAKLPGQPGRATSQWFFNQADNTALDASPDNYTVFGRIADRAGLAVLDAIGDLDIIDGSGGTANSAFGELPVRDYAGSGALTDANLVFVRSVTVVPEAATPYAVPFTLRRGQVRVRRAGKRVRATVSRLPAGTNLRATLKRGQRIRRAIASAPAGRARLRFRGLRRGSLRVTATAPGADPSSVRLRVG